MEVLAKLADVKLLRDLSRVVIIPMLIASYLIQSDFSIFGLTVVETAPQGVQLLQFIGVFFLTSAFAWSSHELLQYVHFLTHFHGLKVLSILFLAFGFVGVFGVDNPVISNLNIMWFYSSFVCGFYMLSRMVEIDRQFT
ncbi:hypothetical protein M5237_004675 [Vibrio parahaemolyticus]|nr:hypothetical protein [Vibrio parahaemolyticus]